MSTMPLSRSCPACEQLTAPHLDRCAECGTEVPAELRSLRGAAERTSLSKPRLLLGAFIAACFAVALFVVAWRGVGRAAALSDRLNPIEHAGMIAVFAGIPALFGSLAVVGAVSRLMTVAGRRTMTDAVRLIVTREGLWESSGGTSYPDGRIDWRSIERIECESRRGSISVAIHRVGSLRPKALVWFVGDADEASAIERELNAIRPPEAVPPPTPSDTP